MYVFCSFNLEDKIKDFCGQGFRSETPLLVVLHLFITSKKVLLIRDECEEHSKTLEEVGTTSYPPPPATLFF